jgi:alpha-galactosidase
MKIALIGVGSFVFGPSAIYDAIVEHNLPDLQLALVDKNLAMADLMAGVAKRLARDAGRTVTVTTHADWTYALAGCDFVVFSAAVQLQKRFDTDIAIIRKHDPTHVITEFGGVAGTSYTLRQIALISQLAADMQRLCPDAWLLNSSNPLPRVCEAARLAGVRTAGFCANSMGGYRTIGRLLQGWDERYPWTKGVERYEAVMAGVNHLTFLLALRDRQTGQDVLAYFIAKAQQDSQLEPVTRKLLRETGYLTTNNDDHIRDFLPPTEHTTSMEQGSHGDASEREHRLQLLHGAGDGTTPVSALLDHRAWEKPIDFIAAFTDGKPVRFHSLNLPNSGQIPNVRRGAYVETPATVSNGTITPDSLPMPGAVAKLTADTAELSQLMVQAATKRDRGMLRHVVDRDPTVVNKDPCWVAMQECLVAHEDLIGKW